jgi:hypothetical protein
MSEGRRDGLRIAGRDKRTERGNIDKGQVDREHEQCRATHVPPGREQAGRRPDWGTAIDGELEAPVEIVVRLIGSHGDENTRTHLRESPVRTLDLRVAGIDERGLVSAHPSAAAAGEQKSDEVGRLSHFCIVGAALAAISPVGAALAAILKSRD